MDVDEVVHRVNEPDDWDDGGDDDDEAAVVVVVVAAAVVGREVRPFPHVDLDFHCYC